ncbi:MAG: hypothetical protein Q7S84_05000 [bacterium]|nr:hypothetical protein [bacterium]
MESILNAAIEEDLAARREVARLEEGLKRAKEVAAQKKTERKRVERLATISSGTIFTTVLSIGPGIGTPEKAWKNGKVLGLIPPNAHLIDIPHVYAAGLSPNAWGGSATIRYILERRAA